MKKMAANVVTCIRIICSFCILFFSVYSAVFYVLYIIAGLTDFLDGYIARKTNTVSKIGSILDTIADFILFAVCAIKVIPKLDMSLWMYIWIAVIFLIKIINIISGFAIQKKLVVIHSVMNKITGIALFIFVFAVPYIDLLYIIIVVCSVATVAAAQEGHKIRTKQNS